MKKRLLGRRGLSAAVILSAVLLASACGKVIGDDLLEPKESLGAQEPEADDKAGEAPKEDDSIREEPGTENEDGKKSRESSQEQEDGQTQEQADEGTAGEVDAFAEKKNWVERQMEALSLEEKVAQMFVLSPEALLFGYTQVTKAGEATRDALFEYPVGGLVYRAVNLQNADQTKEMLENTEQYALSRHGIPIFLAVDEEGGRVARIGNNSGFSVERVPAMAEIGLTGDLQKAHEAGETIGAYLSELGFNVDFAPVADVLSNPENTVIGDRSFGSDEELVAEMAMEVAGGLSSHGIIACVKHFPGHGCTAGDTHEGLAHTDKDLAGFWNSDLIPFRRAVEQKIPMMMVSHISAPAITGGDVPASLSRKMVAELLREQMGYQGIVITDDMGMGAIVDNYGSGEAAVMAIEAGCDMILMSSEFQTAYNALVNAVKSGRVSEEQIEISVRRILNIKYSLSVKQ